MKNSKWIGLVLNSLPLLGMNRAHQFGKTGHVQQKLDLMCFRELHAAPSHTWLRNHCR